MSEKIKIWLVGNTGLRNPNRIQEGFAAYAGSPFVGNLREENEVAFMNFLNEKGIIQNEAGKDESGSHARKWRLMFSRNGFIYPQLKKKDGKQEELGPLDEITPFGRTFLKADTYEELSTEQKQTIVHNWYESILSVLKADEKEEIEKTDILDWFIKNAERYDNIRILKTKLENAIFDRLSEVFIIS